MISNEDNLITSGYSFGLVYRLNERNILKMHFGRHHNGHVIDLDYYDDEFGGPDESFNAVGVPYNYFQIAPSYAYRILNKKIIIPVEIGINFNQRIKEKDIFWVGINEINFDYEIGTGLEYRILQHFLAGIHGIYTGYLDEYQDKHSEWGTFKPQQYGIELSVQYEIGKK